MRAESAQAEALRRVARSIMRPGASQLLVRHRQRIRRRARRRRRTRARRARARPPRGSRRELAGGGASTRPSASWRARGSDRVRRAGGAREAARRAGEPRAEEGRLGVGAPSPPREPRRPSAAPRASRRSRARRSWRGRSAARGTVRARPAAAAAARWPWRRVQQRGALPPPRVGVAGGARGGGGAGDRRPTRRSATPPARRGRRARGCVRRTLGTRHPRGEVGVGSSAARHAARRGAERRGAEAHLVVVVAVGAVLAGAFEHVGAVALPAAVGELVVLAGAVAFGSAHRSRIVSSA